MFVNDMSSIRRPDIRPDTKIFFYFSSKVSVGACSLVIRLGSGVPFFGGSSRDEINYGASTQSEQKVRHGWRRKGCCENYHTDF